MLVDNTQSSRVLSDLSQWVGKEKLCKLAQAAGRKANLSCLETCVGLGCPFLCPPTMVPLLAYCYASGTYSSEEIADRFYEDEYVRALAGEKLPDAPRIRCFRRLHRAVLQQCLADLIQETRGQMKAIPQTASDTQSSRPMSSSERRACEEEAQERIQQAIIWDCMNLDA